VAVGEQFAFQGRVFDTSDADGKLAVRGSGDVLARVVDTFVRMAPAVIDAEVSYADGTTDTLTGTPNHPFWVPAVRDYVPLGKLEVGTVLHVQGGGEAILVSKTWRQGDFEVFDFEVEGLHNFYVRGEGSDAAGVLVHNSTAPKPYSSRRPYMRRSTVKDSWDKAPDGKAPNTKACPDCDKDVSGNPHLKEKRNHEDGWDVDHEEHWKDLKDDLDARDATPKEYRDTYNDTTNTRLRCQGCNRADNQ